jgi:hypothetical protein
MGWVPGQPELYNETLTPKKKKMKNEKKGKNLPAIQFFVSQ